jgi:hypothetical protein
LLGLAALALILGLVFHRRAPTTAQKTESTEPQDAPPGPDHTLFAVTTFSPQWHNANGWPAMCSESFHSLAGFVPEDVLLTASVSATYAAPGKEDVTLHETIEDPQEIAIKSMGEGGGQFRTSLAVGPGILVRARKELPSDYDQTPTMVTVKIKMDLFGRAE